MIIPKKKNLRFYSGLIVANAASTCLTCLFGLFHLQVFLQGYHLPLKVYSIGSTIFTIINTANDVAGAWLVDSLAAIWGYQKHQLVGMSGCIFALAFLTPFFRYDYDSTTSGNDWLDGTHFVTSLSAYDTMWSFHCILLSSIITDHSTMSDRSRQSLLVISKIVYILVPTLVARIGLWVFDVNNLQPLRQFLIVVSIIVSALSLISQKMLTPNQASSFFQPYKVSTEKEE